MDFVYIFYRESNDNTEKDLIERNYSFIYLNQNFLFCLAIETLSPNDTSLHENDNLDFGNLCKYKYITGCIYLYLQILEKS